MNKEQQMGEKRSRDREKEFYRSKGVFLYETRSALIARIGASQVDLAQICASLQDAEIEDDTDILVGAVAHLSKLHQVAKAKLREQRKGLFPIEESE